MRVFPIMIMLLLYKFKWLPFVVAALIVEICFIRMDITSHMYVYSKVFVHDVHY